MVVKSKNGKREKKPSKSGCSKNGNNQKVHPVSRTANTASWERRLTNVTLVLIAILIIILGVQQVNLGSQMEYLMVPSMDKTQLLSPMEARHNKTSMLRLRQQTGVDRKKYLLYITTVFSQEHQEFFRFCWPVLLEKSKLLREAHVIIFSNNGTVLDESILHFVGQLFSNNPSYSLKFASVSTLLDINRPSNRGAWMADDPTNVAQLGANEAVHLAFSEGWFAPYFWVVRINPDVLIRNSTWLRETMDDSSVDGIFVKCSQEHPIRIHTDFFVVRPTACRNNAFDELVPDVYRGQGNHEMTATKEFGPIIHADRHRWLPDNEDSKTFCRVRGSTSSVFHSHGSIYGDKKVCGGLENFDIT